MFQVIQPWRVRCSDDAKRNSGRKKKRVVASENGGLPYHGSAPHSRADWGWPLSRAILEWIISGPREFQMIGGSRAITALDGLFEEIQSTWTADGRRKRLLIRRSQLEQAWLSAAVCQLRALLESPRLDSPHHTKELKVSP